MDTMSSNYFYYQKNGVVESQQYHFKNFNCKEDKLC